MQGCSVIVGRRAFQSFLCTPVGRRVEKRSETRNWSIGRSSTYQRSFAALASALTSSFCTSTVRAAISSNLAPFAAAQSVPLPSPQCRPRDFLSTPSRPLGSLQLFLNGTEAGSRRVHLISSSTTTRLPVSLAQSRLSPKLTCPTSLRSGEFLARVRAQEKQTPVGGLVQLLQCSELTLGFLQDVGRYLRAESASANGYEERPAFIRALPDNTRSNVPFSPLPTEPPTFRGRSRGGRTHRAPRNEPLRWLLPRHKASLQRV